MSQPYGKSRTTPKSDGRRRPDGQLPGEVIGNTGPSDGVRVRQVDGRQYIIATVGWDDMASELVAMSLPE